MEHRGELMIFGEEYRLIRNRCLLIDHSKRTVQMDPKNPDHRKRLLRALRSILISEVVPKVREYERKLGTRINRIRIKRLRGRWGSFSENGNLNFNLWLVCLPRELIHYVVLHEVAHSREMNHGREFRRIIESEFENRGILEKTLRETSIAPPPELM